MRDEKVRSVSQTAGSECGRSEYRHAKGEVCPFFRHLKTIRNIFISSPEISPEERNTMRKHDYTFYLHPDTSEKIDSHLVSADKRSRSEFVEAAVNFYCSVLDTESNQAFLGEEIIRTMKAIVSDMEGRIFSHFRSQDISLSMLSVLFAANLADMTDEEVALLRKMAVKYVDENRRAKSFTVALHDEKAARR